MGRLVPAVVRAFDILELFLDSDVPLSTPEITKRLGLPRTTVHELVHTLVERGYLAPAAERPGHWQLGLRAYQLGARYRENLDLTTEARAVATEVAARCAETVHVGILDGTDVIYVAKVDSTHTVRMVSAVGRRLPAHCTAVGKALLAALPDEELAARLPQDGALTAMTPRSRTHVDDLYLDLEDARRTGVAREICESNPDVACVASPVRDSTGHVVAALSISVPLLRWDDRRERELAELVVEGAETLSARLGAIRDPEPAGSARP